LKNRNQYYQEHKEAFSLYAKRYYEKNKKKRLIAIKKWREAHPDYYKEYRKKLAARLANSFPLD
jgi:hypothetical protein